MKQTDIKNKYIELILNLEKEGYGRHQIKDKLNWTNKKLTNFIYEHKLPISRYNNIPINREQEQIIIGSLLGDGCISYSGKNSKNASLTIKHGDKQKDYVLYKYEFIKNLCNKGMYSKFREDFRPGWVSHTEHSIQTKSLKIFTEYRENWYKSGKKQVYKNDFEKIEGLGLAIWYMDDGNIERCGCTLSTLCFNNESLKIIQSVLKSKFNIETTIQKNNQLHIRAKSFNTFKRLIEPYVIDSLKYKIVRLKFGELRGTPVTDNPDPSSMNDNNVIEKEQRLIGEESTNNPNTSAEHLAGLVEQMNSNNRISIKELKSLLNTLS